MPLADADAAIIALMLMLMPCRYRCAYADEMPRQRRKMTLYAPPRGGTRPAMPI